MTRLASRGAGSRAPPGHGPPTTDLISLVRVARLTDTNDALIIGASDMGGIVQCGIVRAAALRVEAWMVNGDD